MTMRPSVLLIASGALAAANESRAQALHQAPAAAMADLRSRQDVRSVTAILRRIGPVNSESSAIEMADSLTVFAVLPTGAGTDAVLAQRASVHALGDAASTGGRGTTLPYAAGRLIEVALHAESRTIRFIAMHELPKIRDRDWAISTLVQIAAEHGEESLAAVQELMASGEDGVQAVRALYRRRSDLPSQQTRGVLELIAKRRRWN